MKKSFLIILPLLLLLTACKKEVIDVPQPVPPHPAMTYKDLHNAEVFQTSPQAVDMDNDGITDVSFGVLLVGDPILQRDRIQYFAFSKVKRNLLNDANDESPVLNQMDPVKLIHPGYQWFEISMIVLAEKLVTNNGNTWAGKWQNASHKYLPVQVEKNGNVYNGWIELSMDIQHEKLIIHRSGLSSEAGREVKAGY